MGKGKFNYRVAVGLEYDGKRRDAPTLSVKGHQLQADEVVKLARRYGVPVVENAELAKALNGLELDQEIPEKLFEAVALLLQELERSAQSRKLR